MNHAARKNLLVVHLESISRANLWQYRNELGTVWRLMSSALQFNRFFTNSTSTEMTVNDLVFGDSSTRDACTTFKASKTYYDTDKFTGLGPELIKHGYQYLHFATSPYSPEREVSNSTTVIINNPNVPIVCEKALAHMAAAKRENRRFYAYFWDDSSHLAYISPHKEAALGLGGKFRAAYALEDASINRLLSGMAELGLWEDTIIVGFGDHGDEAWSHGLNRGYCHSIPPYASVSWTPMFIYDQGQFEGGMTNSLACVTDLKHTLWRLLLPEAPPQEKTSPFSGIDLFGETRDIAFSQNMFALQRERSDPEQGMVKGYAATDGNYRLVVSSGGGDLERGGMELYCDQVDPANSLNLLRFFKLNRHGDIHRFAPPAEAAAKHFSSVFGQTQVNSLITAFGKLKPALAQFVKDKETEALKEYRKVVNNAPGDLAKRLADGYNRHRNLGQTADDCLPMATAAKKLFSQTEPQLFSDHAFTQIKKE